MKLFETINYKRVSGFLNIRERIFILKLSFSNPLKSCLLIKNLIAFFLILSVLTTHGQSKETKGSVRGLVRDSIDVLKMATVSLHNVKDSSVVNYQLTDSLGKFLFSDLPLDEEYFCLISFVGYNTVKKQFKLRETYKDLSVGLIFLKKTAEVLDEVVIKSIIPVRMVGDTLEFNPDAFRLKKTAVVEDLLYKLPGLVIWNDGSITVNGSKISEVLVNGERFFGKNAKIATQNLPKDIVDKIQVYEHASQKNLNIKLKKEKNNGLFGKIGFGYGTNSRFESDASLNYYSPKTQLALISSSNNVNRSAPDVEQLLAMSTYKSGANDRDYQPGFNVAGINRILATGFIFSNKLSDNNRKTEKIDANYYFNNRKFARNEDRISTYIIGEADKLERFNYSNDSSTTKNHRLNTLYSLNSRTHRYNLIVSLKLNKDNDLLNFSQKDNTYNYDKRLLSNSNGANYITKSGESGGIGINFQKSTKRKENRDRLINGYSVQYNKSLGNTTNLIELYRTTTDSIGNLLENYSRKYDYASKTSLQSLTAAMRLKQFKLSKSMSKNKVAPTLNLSIGNILLHQGNGNKDLVWDKYADGYKINDYLTNNRHYHFIDNMAYIRFETSHSVNLTNQHRRTYDIRTQINYKTYYHQQSSDKEILNFNQLNEALLPDIELKSSDYKTNKRQIYSTLSYKKEINIPGRSLIAALTDSSQSFRIRISNYNLKPSLKNNFAFNFQRTGESKKNPSNILGRLEAVFTKNNFIDSSFYGDYGKGYFYTINGGKGIRYAANLNFNQNIKANKNSEFSLFASANFSFNKEDLYFNRNPDIQLDYYHGYTASVTFKFKDLFFAEIANHLNNFQSKLSNQESNFFSATRHINKAYFRINPFLKMSLGVTLSLDNNYFPNQPRQKFTILNFNASYRFLKDENLEIKLSGNDLLKQNRDYSVFMNNGYQEIVKTNTLVRYFMLTLNYFPRFFGLKKS